MWHAWSVANSRRHFGSTRTFQSGRIQASYWLDGKRHIAPETFPTKADAYAWLDTVSADIQRGAWVDPRAGMVSVRLYAQQWLDGRRNLAVRTRELYQHLLDAHVFPAFGDARLGKVTPSQVRSWHAWIAADHPSTAAKAYRLLSTIMKTAVTDSLIVRSPCRVVGAGTEPAHERPVATVAEIQALADAMPDHLRLVVLLAAWCQLRRGELLGLRRRDVDSLHARLTVEQSRAFTMKGQSLTKVPKSKAGRRTISVPGHITADLADHLERFVAQRPEALVFSGAKGGPLTPQVLSAAWRRARIHVGRPDLRLHDLRHSGLTLSAAMGATVAELMHRAGHSSSAAALRYQHATVERDQVIANALAGLARPADIVPIRDGVGDHSRT